MARDVAFEGLFCRSVDDRAHVRLQLPRIADDELLHVAEQQPQHLVRRLLLQAEHTQRGATLAGAVVRRLQCVANHLLRQGRVVHDHRVDAAGFGYQRRESTVALRERCIDCAGGRDGAGERDAGDAPIGKQCGADFFAVAGQELERRAGYACTRKKTHGVRPNERALLGRFCDSGVARRQRRGDLPGEDREREVPRADAHENAASRQPELVVLARGSGQRLGVVHDPLALRGVVPQEIDGFANLGQAVADGTAGFPHAPRNELRRVRFEQVGCAAQDICALYRRYRVPCGLIGARDIERLSRELRVGIDNRADHAALIRADRALAAPRPRALCPRSTGSHAKHRLASPREPSASCRAQSSRRGSHRASSCARARTGRAATGYADAVGLPMRPSLRQDR